MANIADVHAELFANAASLESVTATAGHFGFLVIWVEVVLHGVFGTFACVER